MIKNTPFSHIFIFNIMIFSVLKLKKPFIFSLYEEKPTATLKFFTI